MVQLIKNGTNMNSEKLEIAKRYESEGKISEAVSLLEEIISGNNDEFDRDVFFELGKIYLFQKKYDLAEKNMYLALNIDQNNKNTISMLGKILKENGKIWRALKMFLKLRRKSGNSLNEIKQIDSEILSIFLSNNCYISAIKYMDKNNASGIEDKSRIYVYLLKKITKLNNSNKSELAVRLSRKALKILKIDNKKIKNAIINEFEIASNITDLKSFPRSLTISLTEKCNLRCKMCSQSKKNNRKELTTEQVNNIISIFPFLEKVLWVGGEVFLYKGFEQLMDLAHKYDIQQNITSNGLLITENYAKKIVDYGIELNLSIDSVNKKTYEFIREGANFDTLLNNVKRIKYYRDQRKINSSLMINAVLSKWNFDTKDTFFDILNFAKENGFDGVNIYIDAFEQDNVVRNKVINSFNERLDEIINLAKKLQLILNNLVYSDYKHILNIQDENISVKEDISQKECIKESDRNFSVNDDKILYDYDKINIPYKNILQSKQCFLPWKKLYVSYNGSILNECHCPELGRLKNEIDCNVENGYNNIMEIWNSEKLVKIRKAIIENNLQCTKHCYLNEEYRKPIAFR